MTSHWASSGPVGGGLSAKAGKAGIACVAAPSKTTGTGSPAPPLILALCRYLPVNCCSFLFPSQKRQIQAGFQSGKNVFVTKWVWLMSVAYNIACLWWPWGNAVAWFWNDSLCMFWLMMKIFSWNPQPQPEKSWAIILWLGCRLCQN